MASETRIGAWTLSHFEDVKKSVADRALRTVSDEEWSRFAAWEKDHTDRTMSRIGLLKFLASRREEFEPPRTIQQKIVTRMHELEGESYETIAAQIVALIEKERADGK
jgi:hypothetical protein